MDDVRSPLPCPVGLPLFDDSPVPMFWIASGELTLNRAAEELLACSSAELATSAMSSRSLLDAVHEASQSPRKTSSTGSGQAWVLTPKGARIEGTVLVAASAQGDCWACFCSSDGVTEDADEPSLLASILDDLPLGLFVTTADGVPCYVNRTGARLAKGGPVPDRGDVPVAVTSTPVRDGDGKVVLVVTVFAHETKRRAADRALESIQAELREAQRHDGKAEVAKRVLRTVEELVNELSLSNSGIVWALEDAGDLTRALEPSASPADTPLHRLSAIQATLRRQHAEIQRELKAGRESLEQVKAFVSSQQELALVRRVPERCSLEVLLRQAISVTEVPRSVSLEISVDSSSAELDLHLAVGIVSNLLSNAVASVLRQAPPEPRVRLIGESSGGLLRVTVEDNGQGFEPRRADELFRSHLKLHTNSVAAREMGGELSAASAGPGLGATFVLTVPQK